MSFYREIIYTSTKLTLLGFIIMLLFSLIIKMIYFFIRKGNKNNENKNT